MDPINIKTHVATSDEKLVNLMISKTQRAAVRAGVAGLQVLQAVT